MSRSRAQERSRRHARRRKRVIGTAARPRLQVVRSLHHLYAFVVDDTKGHTLAAASTRERELASLASRTNLAAAKLLGERIGRRAKDAGIGPVVFDTGGRSYHGRVAALADAARAAGLEF
ncbi:MAG: 50S ribosomal protein L18 [Vulcanimicrobiaceae bacterium]